MKLTSTATYLSLILKTLEEEMIPDLQSANVKGNAQFVLSIVRELLRREQDYAASLPMINDKGSAIEADMWSALGEKPVISSGEQANPIDRFGNLSKTLTELAELLCRNDIDITIRAPLLRRAADWEYESHALMLSLGSKKPAEANAPSHEPLPRDALQNFIHKMHPDGSKAQLIALDRIPGGFNKQTSAITVQDASSRQQQLIVRKCERTPTSLHKSYDLEREFHLVAAVNRTGFPAPKPVWMGKNVAGVDASFYIMERLPGKPPGSFMGGAAQLPEQFVLEWAELLARLHAIPLDSLSDFIQSYDSPMVLTETVSQTYRRYVADIRAYAEQTKPLPSPTLIHLFDWLEHNVPDDESRPVLTHGDFGLHNMLSENEHVTGVLDWEVAAFGSPLKDLAYIKPVVERHMEWARFLAHYIACSGKTIDTSAMPYYHAFTAMWGFLSLNRGTLLVQEGKISETRLTFFELAVNPQFMKMGLDSSPLTIIPD
jgi:aminoglycoside phosphotransferase (APT) family kinase protein